MPDRRNVIPEASVTTDFAITSVNVPDRLDAQEVRARAEAEEDAPHRRHVDFRPVRRWLFRFAAVVVVGIAAFLSLRLLLPVWREASAERISARLTRALGQPVHVASAGLRVAPRPGLVVEGIEAPGQFRLETVSLRFSWESVARLLKGGGWVWGEATVGPIELSPESAFALLRALPALSSAVPAPVTTVKFESVRFRGAALLPARYQVIAERSPGQSFSSISVEDLDSNGQVSLSVTLAAADAATFRLHAFQWRAPFGPATEWAESSAEGSFAPGRLQVDSYSANGYLGVITGSLIATRAGGWTVHGSVQSTDIDLDSVQRELRKRAKLPQDPKGVPVIQGFLDSSGALSGQGATLGEALDRITASGKVQIRLATLNGINLGASAVNGGTGGGLGGVTRFGELEALASVSSGALHLRDIGGTAGALQVRGTIGVDRNLGIGGILRAEVAAAGGAGPIDVRVSGTVFEPRFDH